MQGRVCSLFYCVWLVAIQWRVNLFKINMLDDGGYCRWRALKQNQAQLLFRGTQLTPQIHGRLMHYCSQNITACDDAYNVLILIQ